jgi:hypothetical protein
MRLPVTDLPDCSKNPENVQESVLLCLTKVTSQLPESGEGGSVEPPPPPHAIAVINMHESKVVFSSLKAVSKPASHGSADEQY